MDKTKELSHDGQHIHSCDNSKYLQRDQDITLKDEDVHQQIEVIKSVIIKELNGSGKNGINYNQVNLNAAFRMYFNLLEKYNKTDQYFIPHISLAPNCVNEKFVVMQHFVLLTAKSEHFDPASLRTICLQILILAVDKNETFLLTILKTLNLIFKKWPHLDAGNELSLEHIYFCLQSNQLGMRDEMILLLKHICLCRSTAFLYFVHIVHFWPWTNRSKLYMIGCILKRQKLSDLLEASGTEKKDFYKGLRLSLNFKSLLAPSQSVIQSLSSQSCQELLDECMDILENGSLQELRNFNAHWFSRLQMNEEFFQMLQCSSLMSAIINHESILEMSADKRYRVILLFSLFSKEILHLYPETFTYFCSNIIVNCYELELQTQLLIFKFTVDNLVNINLEDAMAFFAKFIQTHMLIENAQFRNTILGKMPSIINHLSKVYCKWSAKNDSQPKEPEESILNFFHSLQTIAEAGICSDVYQPKIFGLKMLEIFIKSLYGKSLKKNAKNCSLAQNHQLGELLKTHQIFNGVRLCETLMSLLNDPSGFDDALNLTVSLISLIQPDDNILQDAREMSRKCCALSDIDEANLSCLYARVYAENCSVSEKVTSFMQSMMEDIKKKMTVFEKDPLNACKSRGFHLFSSVNVINELFQNSNSELSIEVFEDVLLTIENITTSVLKMMNMCNTQDCSEVTAASFEDMDKSLQMLVVSSEFVSSDHEKSRKYLLMTFWLTLKASCDISASIGEILVRTNKIHERRTLLLKRCLQISVMVLTKCRHKGAIETAGGTIGKLTKSITSQFALDSGEYNLLYNCIHELFNSQGSEVSTTRRGAGFAIMFLHIIKNEDNRTRPLLCDAITNLLKPFADAFLEETHSNANCDRKEALHLHYLCVLVRDTELKEAVNKYYNEIMMAAILQIDNPEWTVCNAALQLFGALVPKIVGQRQATEFCEFLPWEPSEVTFCEITRKLKMPFDYILKYFSSGKCSTRSIILFLEFLHKVEYIHKSSQPEGLVAFREMIWCLLRHHCEKVRILAAKCFVRSHEFSLELPLALSNIARIIFTVKNENFFQGLIQTVHEGILKLQHDSNFVISNQKQQQHFQQIKCILIENFNLHHQYKFYTLCKLWDMLILLKANNEDSILIKKLKDVHGIPKTDTATIDIAIDLWLERIG